MLSPAVFGETIAVVDRSGKVVSSSKHVLNVLKEARYAYRERKAEITAARKGSGDVAARNRPRLQRAYTMDDERSPTSSRRSHRIHHSDEEGRQHRPHLSRTHTRGPPHTSPTYTAQDAIFDYNARSSYPPQLPTTQFPRPPHSPGPASPDQRLQCHGTAKERELGARSLPASPLQSRSTDFIDMDLAYGDAPPNLISSPRHDETELTGLVGRVQGLLDEANCVKHSVTATITSLQRNPDAMAAVALTLAEISNLVKQMAPGALLSVRRAAPTVFSLLASPQFLIAAGVGVGITVVAFGGYKIIKKIQAKKDENESMDQMLMLGSDVSRIENWRQGIAEEESRSMGTSVEGEFITPIAASLSRIDLRDEEIERPRRKSTRSSPREAKGAKSSSSRHSTNPKTKDGRSKRDGRDEPKRKSAKPSPLRLMFT